MMIGLSIAQFIEHKNSSADCYEQSTERQKH